MTVKTAAEAPKEQVNEPDGKKLKLCYKSFPVYDKLKLLLISGKSGTMFFKPAYSSKLQFTNDGSRGATLAMFPEASVVTK